MSIYLYEGLPNGFLHAFEVFIVALGLPLHPDAKPTGEKGDVLATGGNSHTTTGGEMGVNLRAGFQMHRA